MGGPRKTRALKQKQKREQGPKVLTTREMVPEAALVDPSME